MNKRKIITEQAFPLPANGREMLYEALLERLQNVSEQDETELRAEIRRRCEIYKFGKLPVSPLTKILRERLSK